MQDLGRATLSLDRIEAVKNAVLPEHGAQAWIRAGARSQYIRFEQVDFSYANGAPACAT